jgi:hypothetical protein
VDRRHCGLVVVALVAPGPHRVSGVVGTGGIDAVVVEAGDYEQSLLIAS